MIQNAEEGVLFLLGETMALGLMLKAVIASHPNPAALLRVTRKFQQQAAKALAEKPPANLQLFRYEQLLDELVSAIPKQR